MNEEDIKIDYHFLTASTSNYKENNFQELVKEEEDNDGYIYWHINVGNGMHSIKKDDICYIYYSNLPDQSSRIFFVGKVYDSDYGKSKDEKSIYKYAEEGKRYAKMKLMCVSFDDKDRFSLNNLRYKYNLVHKQGQFSYLHVDPKIHKKLIADIKKALDEGKKHLKTIHQLFNDKYCVCVFKDEYKCKSFQEENGFNYIERHHLVERNLIRKYSNNKELENLIENTNNNFLLCANCHRKIHHSVIKERKYMIKTLYNLKKEFYDNHFYELKNGKTTLEWLYEIYKCN